MKSTKRMIPVAAICLMGFGASGAVADAALYNAKLCQTCHGPDGDTPILPTYPKLGGQPSAYCQQQMKDIKSGARSNALSAVMTPLMQTLTDDEIVKLCDYLEGL